MQYLSYRMADVVFRFSGDRDMITHRIITVVEVCYEKTQLTWKVTPGCREKDIVILPKFNRAM